MPCYAMPCNERKLFETIIRNKNERAFILHNKDAEKNVNKELAHYFFSCQINCLIS